MKVKTPISVSVGIVAYNEEKNIRQIIGDVLRQRGRGWKLNTVYVACGGCTDNTVDIVRSMRIANIRLFVNPKREGKAVDEQKIFQAASDDVLVLFDADVRLQGDSVIETLIQPFHTDPQLQETGGNPRPYNPVSFLEKAVYTTFMVLDASRGYLKNGNNVYGASGQCIALRKALYKSIVFPRNIVAEDDYIYFHNLKNGGSFAYCPKAIVHYKLPKTLTDYFRQTLRADPAAVIENVDKYFGDVVAREYHRPLAFYAAAIAKSFWWNPLGALSMVCIRVVSRITLLYTSKHYNLDWFTAASTK